MLSLAGIGVLLWRRGVKTGLKKQVNAQKEPTESMYSDRERNEALELATEDVDTSRLQEMYTGRDAGELEGQTIGPELPCGYHQT